MTEPRKPHPMSRRAILGRPAGPARIRPPWATQASILSACSRCGACATACPTRIIVTGDGGWPEIAFSGGECTFCAACAEACPEPEIFVPRPARPWSLSVEIAATCLAAQGIVCQTCRDACPENAIRFPPKLGGVAGPQVDQAACSGCGACVAPCPAGAIALQPQASRHV